METQIQKYKYENPNTYINTNTDKQNTEIPEGASLHEVDDTKAQQGGGDRGMGTVHLNRHLRPWLLMIDYVIIGDWLSDY